MIDTLLELLKEDATVAALAPAIGLGMLLFIGHVLRSRVRLLQKLYLPSSVIAGAMGLVILQSARGLGSPLPEALTAGWGAVPGLLINVVFACLFLGVDLPRPSTMWRRAGPQVIYGQMVAWGQYVVGIGLVLLVLIPLFDLPQMLGGEKAAQMFAGILPVGFEGGHGTAAGLAGTFADHQWAEGKDFALASATGGIVGAIVVGMILVNWAARRGYLVGRKKATEMTPAEASGIFPVGSRLEAGKLTVSSDSIDTFTLHLVAVAAAILFGILLKAALLGFGRLTGSETINRLLASFPLFPLCMLGGLIVQFIEQKFDKHNLISGGLMRRVQNCALDFLVVAAIATIKIEVIAKGWLPLLILIAAGMLWNVFCVTVLARRLLPDAWFERSIAEMGQSMGVTATGLLLLRTADPDYKTPAADAFAYKQLAHEPFMGGGLWTSTAIPLLALYGGMPILYIAVGAMTLWTVTVFVAARLRRRKA